MKFVAHSDFIIFVFRLRVDISFFFEKEHRSNFFLATWEIHKGSSLRVDVH